jgi:formylglycine-generating enzyme required for sulfatase activity
MTNCGPGGRGTESCCTSLEVTGGTFYRSYDTVWYLGDVGQITLAPNGGPADEADPASVSSFRLDKYLVTVGRFRQFLSAWNAGWVPLPASGKHTHLNAGKGLEGADGGYEPGWIATDDTNVAPPIAYHFDSAGAPTLTTWTTSVAANENLPVNYMSWIDAYAFCIWDGGFLPSIPEGEYAAAGGDQQREYPWGSTDPGTSNQYAIYGNYFPSSSLSYASPSLANIALVGSAPLGAGRWGQLDLGGEVYELWLDADAVDMGGGYFESQASDMVPSNLFAPGLRASSAPTGGDVTSGFRCARTP